MHRKVAAALVAALALGIASCGGSESEPLSRAQLVERIETACRQAQRRAQAAVRAARDSNGAFIDAFVAAQRQIVERLDEFEPADGASSSFEAFKQAIDDRLELTERLESLDGDELQRAMQDIEEQGGAVAARAQAAAERLGLSEGCV